MGKGKSIEARKFDDASSSRSHWLSTCGMPSSMRTWRRRLAVGILGVVGENAPAPISIADITGPPLGLLEVSELVCGGHCATSFCGGRPSATLLVADVLACCHLCGKSLHGEDIYMYMGELRFCRDSCRWKHMEIEKRMKRKRKYRVEDVDEAIANGPVFFTVDD